MPATAKQVYAKLGQTNEKVAVDMVEVADITEQLAAANATLANSRRQEAIATAVALATFAVRPYFDPETGTLISVVNGALSPSVPYLPESEVSPVEVDIDGDGQPDNVEPPVEEPPVE